MGMRGIDTKMQRKQSLLLLGGGGGSQAKEGTHAVPSRCRMARNRQYSQEQASQTEPSPLEASLL